MFLGAEDLGTLEPSKWADFVVLDAEPADGHQEHPEDPRGVYRWQRGAVDQPGIGIVGS